jgi:sugar fermentation stimulation protein A
LIGIEDSGGYAVVDTRLQSRVFEEAVSRGLLPWLEGCRIAVREPVFNGGRLDYLLDCNGSPVLVETKSAVLRSRDGFYAMYPDCPSIRGRKHVRELVRIAGSHGRALLVFSAALPRVVAFKPYWEGDPVLAGLIGEAARSGVDVRAYSFHMDETGLIVLDEPDLPVIV